MRLTDDQQPHFHFEDAAQAYGYSAIAGVDEVGRGPLAGPVVAAAVILNRDHLPAGIKDSKLLSNTRRQRLFDEICEYAIFATASVSSAQIDRVNIKAATLWAMTNAIKSLAIQADYVLIDGRDTPPMRNCRTRAIPKGDQSSLSIAAASIVAKVTRDQLMIKADAIYSGYYWINNKGYGTRAHRAAIVDRGPSPLHRQSFEPIKGLSRSVFTNSGIQP